MKKYGPVALIQFDSHTDTMEKIITKVLSFFRACARKKWPHWGSRIIENLMTRVKGFPPLADSGFSVQVSVSIISFP